MRCMHPFWKHLANRILTLCNFCLLMNRRLRNQGQDLADPNESFATFVETSGQRDGLTRADSVRRTRSPAFRAVLILAESKVRADELRATAKLSPHEHFFLCSELWFFFLAFPNAYGRFRLASGAPHILLTTEGLQLTLF